MALPDFLVVGAPKAGTTALHAALSRHPGGLGKYGEQLKHAFTLFPREQVLVLRYRLLVDEPAQSLDRICAFLGVATGVIREIPRENVTAHPEQTLAHRAAALAMRASDVAGQALPGAAGATLTSRIERFLQRGNRKRQPLDWEQRNAMLPAFEQDIRLLQQVLGEDFSDWLAPRDRSGNMVGARLPGHAQARNGQPRARSGQSRASQQPDG
ncbi:MAG: sulfotransferase domain-containing protein [Trebonia sp.]